MIVSSTTRRTCAAAAIVASISACFASSASAAFDVSPSTQALHAKPYSIRAPTYSMLSTLAKDCCTSAASFNSHVARSAISGVATNCGNSYTSCKTSKHNLKSIDTLNDQKHDVPAQPPPSPRLQCARRTQRQTVLRPPKRAQPAPGPLAGSAPRSAASALGARRRPARVPQVR